jgi:LPXTG-site transpeptidase (sortase) family protein
MQVNSWSQLWDALWLRKVSFLVTFFFIFLLSYALLAWLDFLPELVTKEAEAENESELVVNETSDAGYLVGPVVTVEEIELPAIPEATSSEPVYPLSITFESLNKTVPVLNPTSRLVADLDAALLDGVVRHPDSATLEQTGTVFILGHSSYLPSVRNKNFQAFNGIQNLKWGDIITVEALDETYVYRVDKVYRARAQDVTVPIAGPTQRLFLATCNSFGSVDDRYIVEAELIEVRK